MVPCVAQVNVGPGPSERLGRTQAGSHRKGPGGCDQLLGAGSPDREATGDGMLPLSIGCPRCLPPPHPRSQGPLDTCWEPQP